MAESVETLPDGTVQLAPQTGTAFTLKQGQHLTILTPTGAQVADLLAFNAHDLRETLSNGRTFDYNRSIHLTTNSALYSNRSNALMTIVSDSVGVHDFLFTPCSTTTFKKLYPDSEPVPGCFGNFAFVLQKFGIGEDAIPVPFNCFMNVKVDGETGRIKNLPPTAREGDWVEFVAERDLVVAVTACSAGRSNGGVCKPVAYRIK